MKANATGMTPAEKAPFTARIAMIIIKCGAKDEARPATAEPAAAIFKTVVLPKRSPSGPKIMVKRPKHSMYDTTDQAATVISTPKSPAMLIRSGAAA